MAAAIEHGGGLIAARRDFPNAPEPWLDLSTGINPTPYPVNYPPEAFTRLPEPGAVAALEGTAATAYGLADPALAAAAPGTQSLIHLLPRLVPANEVAILGPTYGEHAAAWALAGSRIRLITQLDSAERAGVVVVCNPNNPDGRQIPAGDLLAVAAGLAAAGGMLVVDEAFADLEGQSLAAALPRPGLLVLRSFGKTYGLAGVRLGFALAQPDLAAAIRAALGPWAVSGPALWAGQAALADAPWRHATAARLGADADRLDAMLRAAGMAIVGGTRLFRLAEAGDALAISERLAQAGILVRRFAGRPRLLRFGLPPEHGWSRLNAALGR